MTHHITDERLAEVLTEAYGSPEWTMADVRAARAVEAAVLSLAAPQGGAKGAWIGVHALASDFANAIRLDEEYAAEQSEEFDMAEGTFGPNVGALLRKIASEFLSLHTAPAPAVPSDDPLQVAAALRRIAKERESEFNDTFYLGYVAKQLEHCPVCNGDGLTDEFTKCQACNGTGDRAALTAAHTSPAQSGIRAEFVDAHIQRTAQTVGSMVAETADQRGADAVAEFVRRAMQHVVILIDATPPALHPDDAAVDRFAIAMKTKLAASRAKGRGGWDDPAQCSVEHLARLLVEHIAKGDPVDVANFAMMLHQRGADHAVLAAAQQPAVPEDVARVNKQMLEALEEALPALPTWHRPKVNAVIDAARAAEKGGK